MGVASDVTTNKYLVLNKVQMSMVYRSHEFDIALTSRIYCLRFVLGEDEILQLYMREA